MAAAQGVAPAQHAPAARYQLSGGYSYLSNSMNGVPGARHGLNGFNAALAFPGWHNLRFKAEYSSYRGTNLNAPQNVFFLLGGGQYERHVRRETVFGEAMVGDGGINRDWGANRTPGGTASFAAVAGGGLDTPVTQHVAIRVSGAFQYSYFALIQSTADPVPYRAAGLPTYFGRVATGLVWGF